jgi:DNA-binding MarR family transcriptional regulator
MPTPTRSATQAAIKQTKPFSGPEHEAFVALQRAAGRLAQGVTEALKPAGLTPAQYNVLRILRGAEPAGLACGEVTERLVTRDPDMTRLLDRMQAHGLVTRARGEDDRRVVLTRITAKGLRLLATLDEPIAELHRRQLGHLGRTKLRELTAFLEAVALGPPAPPAAG